MLLTCVQGRKKFPSNNQETENNSNASTATEGKRGYHDTVPAASLFSQSLTKDTEHNKKRRHLKGEVRVRRAATLPARSCIYRLVRKIRNAALRAADCCPKPGRMDATKIEAFEKRYSLAPYCFLRLWKKKKKNVTPPPMNSRYVTHDITKHCLVTT